MALAAVAVRTDRPRDLFYNTFFLMGGAALMSGAVNLVRNLIAGPAIASLLTGAGLGTIGMLAFFAVRARPHGKMGDDVKD